MRYTNTPKTSLKGLNAELVKVQDACEDVLDRRGDGANFMDTDLDMNSHRILNLPSPVLDQEPLRKGDAFPFYDQTEAFRDEAVQAAEAAQASASSAEQSAASAANSAAKAKEVPEITSALLIAQGLSGEYGFFEKGFTYNEAGDVGIDAEGNSWIYVGAGAPNKVVAAGTVPSAPDYEQVTFNSVSAINVTNENGGSVQDFIDNLDANDINLSIYSDQRANLASYTAGTDAISGATLRDTFVTARSLTDLTDCHAFADRTVITSFTDVGTYGTFDATTEYAHESGIANHLYTFQGRGKKTGAGDLEHYASFYSQPSMSGGTVTHLHHARVYDVAGDSTVTHQHGVHIRPLTRGDNNYAIFSWGDTPSIHVGHVTIGDFVVDTTAALCVKNKVNMAGFDQSGVVSDCGGNSGALTAYNAFKARVNLVSGSYTVPIVSGYTVEDANFGAGAIADVQYGFYIKDQTKGTANAAIRLGVSAGSQKWNLYATGDAQNYLKGSLGLGVFQPAARLEVAASQAGNEIAPIKMQAGSLLPTPVDGCFEFDGVNLYFTVGGVRRVLSLT